jgi:hypothetical protein
MAGAEAVGVDVGTEAIKFLLPLSGGKAERIPPKFEFYNCIFLENRRSVAGMVCEWRTQSEHSKSRPPVTGSGVWSLSRAGQAKKFITELAHKMVQAGPWFTALSLYIRCIKQPARDGRCRVAVYVSLAV